jgi:CheY-like chemotaxis protein
MEQVILNIAINARDAMPQGGRLVITTGQKSIRQNDNLDIEDDCAIYISLEDNGQGIPPESLEKIFDPFYSTKGVNQGTGLGLSVVYGIVRQHKGDIHVASQMGQGTRFDIYLPCSHDREAVRAQGQAINSEHLGSGERIALIEDDEAILDLAHKVLEQNQYIPLAFSRARDFWASWDEHAGDYDLLFSDIVLSDENIFTLLERVEERSPDIPIVLTSGYFSNDYLLNHIQDKGYSFIQKPFQPADLLKTIKNALNGKQSFA